MQNKDIILSPKIDDFLETRKEASITVFSGGNNSGKSLILKSIKKILKKQAYLAGPVRFYHVNQISSSIRDPRQLDNLENQFENSLYSEQNAEQNFIDLNQILIGLDDRKREYLFEICGELIGATFKLEQVDKNNKLSPSYVDVDGNNLSVSSTGTRLLMTMVGLCLDDRFSVILIDEPELGLSPKVQEMFSGFLQDEVKKSKYFPHLKNIFISTHSHLFLDKKNIKNNFIVIKSEENIEIKQTKDFTEFHKLQFNLLGNKLESLFLPSAIITVEGKTDFGYIDNLVQINFPDKTILVRETQGDGGTKDAIYNLTRSFGDIQKSPMRSRIFVVLDSVTQKGLKETLIKMGILEDNIVIWDNNGIEYVYPDSIMQSVYSCSLQDIKNINIIGDIVTIGAISYKKDELNKKVLALLSGTTVLPEQIEIKLLNRLRKVLEQ